MLSFLSAKIQFPSCQLENRKMCLKFLAAPPVQPALRPKLVYSTLGNAASYQSHWHTVPTYSDSPHCLLWMQWIAKGLQLVWFVCNTYYRCNRSIRDRLGFLCGDSGYFCWDSVQPKKVITNGQKCVFCVRVSIVFSKILQYYTVQHHKRPLP